MIRSMIMKRPITFITSAVTAVSLWTGAFCVSAEDNYDWKSAYMETVTEYTHSDANVYGCMYDLYDIDGDGTPELLISNGDNHVSTVCIYTFRNGHAEFVKDEAGENVTYLGTFGSFRFARQTGQIILDDYHQGVWDISVYKIEDGILKLINAASSNSDVVGEDNAEYYVGDDKVSKADFLTFMDGLYQNDIETVGRKYSLSQLAPLGGEMMTGDANADGKLNVRDAAYIAKMLAQGKGSSLHAEADFNGDGKVNVRDAAAIAKLLAYGKG